MSYEYAGMQFNTAHQAAKASVSDYLFAGGNNSTKTVAGLDVNDVAAELLALIAANEWTVEPEGYTDLADLVREVIGEANECLDAE